MKNINVTILFNIIFNFVFTQEVPLKGVVTIHNSKYETGKIEYVNDAYITAPFSKPATSDNQGNFKLIFTGIDDKTSVKINVEKANLEVVNSYDLQYVTLGRSRPLRVYLTSKGKLAISQTEIYNISKKTLFADRDRIIADLRGEKIKSQKTIEELRIELGAEVTNRFEAEKMFNQKIEELLDKLPKFAQELAMENLDFASDLYIKAYNDYKKGKIQSAIEILDEDKLEKSYKEATADIIKAEKLINIGNELKEKKLLQIEQIIKSYELKAKISEVSFQYQESSRLYEKIIEKCLANKIHEIQITKWYYHSSKSYLYKGDYSKALKYAEENLTILKKYPDNLNVDLTSAYSLLGSIYKGIGNYEKALYFHKKTIKRKEKTLNKNDFSLAISYNNLSGIFANLNKTDSAIYYLKKSIEIRKKDPSKKASLAITYDNLATIYTRQIDYENALKYTKIALNIFQQVYKTPHPDLAITYDNYGYLLSEMKDYNEAIKYHLKAIDIFKSLNYESHSLTVSYNNIASSYQNISQYRLAIEYQKKSIEILENDDDETLELGMNYWNLGRIYDKQNQYANAMIFLEKGMNIFVEFLNESNKNRIDATNYLTEFYSNLGILMLKKRSYRQAISYFQKSINLKENANSNYYIGFCHYYLREYSTAIIFFEKAFNINPEIKKGKDYCRVVGLAYCKNKQFEKGSDFFYYYQKLFPQDGMAYINWSFYYSLKNDKESALTNINKALKFGFSDVQWLIHEESLDYIRNEKEFIQILEKLKK